MHILRMLNYKNITLTAEQVGTCSYLVNASCILLNRGEEPINRNVRVWVEILTGVMQYVVNAYNYG